MEAEQRPLLEARLLTRHFRVGRSVLSRRVLHAIDDVDLTIDAGEIVAVVGESGSGKSTLARVLALMYKPTSGEILFEGRPVHTLRTRHSLKTYRRSVQLVFQDPFSQAHPFYQASHGIMRALKLHRPELDRANRVTEAASLLEQVGLTPVEDFMTKRPFELSGGQLQRFGFAQALACHPRIVLADEPVSMLDVSIRVGVLNLMDELRKRRNLAFLYITHDIASACYLADRVVVMYGGHIVETASVETLLAQPKHPYTQLLLSAVPDPRAETEEPTYVGATIEPAQVIDPSDGCRFRERCPVAITMCSTTTPRLAPVGRLHQVACHVAQAEIPESLPSVRAAPTR